MKTKRVLVTGGAGFVGRNLIKHLYKNGYTIYSFERNKKVQLNSAYVKDIIIGDITNWKVTENCFKKLKIDLCFHLASHALVDSGTISPLETLKNNIEGTWNILESSRMHHVKRVIIASTAHVYGDNKRVPYKEYYTPRPSRIYETSKTCADIIAQSYIVSYNAPIFIGRFSNIYGPGDMNTSRIIPKTIGSILQRENPTIWGGTAVRDYLYIDDACNAYVKLAGATIGERKNHIFNFGSGTIINVKELVKKIIDLSGENLQIDVQKLGRKDEIQTQYVSSDKARRLLKWKAKVPLEDGLKKTLKWYKNSYEKKGK